MIELLDPGERGSHAIGGVGPTGFGHAGLLQLLDGACDSEKQGFSGTGRLILIPEPLPARRGRGLAAGGYGRYPWIAINFNKLKICCSALRPSILVLLFVENECL